VPTTCRDCPHPDYCAADRCVRERGAPGWSTPAGTAVAVAMPPRQPIDLPPLGLAARPEPEPPPPPDAPGGIMGALMRWQDAGPARARRRHPLLRPFVSAETLEPLSDAALIERVREVMSATERSAFAPMPPAAPAAAAPPGARLAPGQKLSLSVARSGAVVAMLDGEVLDAGDADAVLAVVRQWLPPR
jgi:hypothetical protein